MGITTENIKAVATVVGSTWLRDVPRLIMEWPINSPLSKILETFIVSEKAEQFFADITFEHLPIFLNFLPLAARPLILALGCIREISDQRNSRTLNATLKKLVEYQSPNGTWCEDVMITSLSCLCLYISGRYPSSVAKGLNWLTSIQYPSGAWPAFNQLTNWDVGLAAHIYGTYAPHEKDLIQTCAQFLSQKANQDGSFGTLSPYTFPDTDDTAIALLGLVAGHKTIGRYQGEISQTVNLLLSLQNPDGSWSTFPEFIGFPPKGTSLRPVHIKSVDVTVHVTQALLKAGVDIRSPQIQQAIWWLIYQQNSAGSWKSTWYLGDTYATSQTLELLADYNLWPQARALATNWLITNQLDTGSWPMTSAGECGLAIAALIRNSEPPTSPVIQKGLEFIHTVQQTDGSFLPTYNGFYASGLYYEDPITEALAVVKALKTYLFLTQKVVFPSIPRPQWWTL